MKRIILPVSIAFLAMINTGCNNNPEKKEDSMADSIALKKDSVNILETTTVDEMLKPSDDHFLAALDAFDKKEKSETAKHIRDGIMAFKKETSADTGTTKIMADAAMKNLDGLDEKVEKGTVTDVAVLENAFNKAEDVNTHRMYVMLQDIVIPEKQEGMKTGFSKALTKLKSLVSKDKGKMKTEGERIVKEGESIETKLKAGAKIPEDEFKRFNSEARLWLKTHL